MHRLLDVNSIRTENDTNHLEKECNDVAVCRVWRCDRSWMVRKSPKTLHGTSCCWAHAHLHVVGDAVKADGRRTTILKGLDIRSSRLWRRGEGTLWTGPLSRSCTSPRTCNELGEVCSPPFCCKGSEKPSHDATCSLLCLCERLYARQQSLWCG
jgi:hypothetical protein